MSDKARTRAGIGTPLASLLIAVYLLAAFNAAFWRRLWVAVSPTQAGEVALVAGMGVLLLLVVWTILSLVAWRRVARPAWIALLMVAAIAAYFMDTYALVIDRVAIQSVFETDVREAGDWVSWRMLPYLLAALLPAVAIARMPLRYASLPREFGSKLALAAATAAAFALALGLAFQPLASLARNHRELRHLINPTAAIQAIYGYTRRAISTGPAQRAAVGADARLGASWNASPRPRMLVLVVGESARASSFGALGYARATSPRLAGSDVVAFSNVHSCGTSTAVSLPCMFSNLGASDYSDSAGRTRETLLDVLAHAGLRALWLDNNTGSKQIARQQEELFLAAATDARFCNQSGCFDDILVDELAKRLATGTAPPLVILHQKGSHGPSYFERYPLEFRRFQPTCDTNALEHCSQAQIVNTYDNTILYTDHTLGRVLDLLHEHAADIDSAMLYVSDHGESTGERGMFLHGAPLFMAPEEQTHIPMFLWMSDGFASRVDVDASCVQAGRDARLSHDNVFHSVLGLLDVHTRAYRPGLDLSASCRARDGQRLVRTTPVSE